MKKLIAICTIASSLIFGAFALAQESTNGSSTDSYSGSDQPGTTGAMDAAKDKAMTEEKVKDTTAMGEEYWKTAKSCTDDMGKTYKKGEKGFKDCVKMMKKKEQMGGMAGDESSVSDSSIQQPGTSDSSMSDSNGLSGSSSSDTSSSSSSQ